MSAFAKKQNRGDYKCCDEKQVRRRKRSEEDESELQLFIFHTWVREGSSNKVTFEPTLNKAKHPGKTVGM